MRVFSTVSKFAIGSLLLLCSVFLGLPNAIAQMEEANDTRIEKYEDLTETEMNSQSEMNSDMSQMESMESEGMAEPSSETRVEEQMQETQSSDMSMYDVRRTEAFNLVSSAYRGDFEDQGIESYAVLISNYEAGELTAQDLIQAAIDAGELSPSAMEDAAYVEAVNTQLSALSES